MFPTSGDGRETPTLLGPLERANLSHWIRADTRSLSFYFGETLVARLMKLASFVHLHYNLVKSVTTS
jgi:hypothetical protein